MLDAISGELLGIVTSNARHHSGATLPHLNFCIPNAELVRVFQWANGHHMLPRTDVPCATSDAKKTQMASPEGEGAR